MRIAKEDRNTIIVYLTIIAIAALLSVYGCGRKTAPVVQLADHAYQIPVISGGNQPVPLVVSDPVPSEPPSYDPQGQETPTSVPPSSIALPALGELEMTITVPASKTPTVVRTYKKKVNPAKQALTNTPTHNVVADKPGVTAEQPHKAVWWRWVLVVLLVLLVIMAVIQRVVGLSPVEIVKRVAGIIRLK